MSLERWDERNLASLFLEFSVYNVVGCLWWKNQQQRRRARPVVDIWKLPEKISSERFENEIKSRHRITVPKNALPFSLFIFFLFVYQDADCLWYNHNKQRWLLVVLCRARLSVRLHSSCKSWRIIIIISHNFIFLLSLHSSCLEWCSSHVLPCFCCVLLVAGLKIENSSDI